MEHFTLRCKHCGIEYTYCTYGNEDGCSLDYCSECQKVIDDALSKIPIKYIPKIKNYEEDLDFNRINCIFDEEKAKYQSENPINISQLMGDMGYDIVEKCYIDRVAFYRCYNIGEKPCFKTTMEYDLVNKRFTGKCYRDHNNPMFGYRTVSQLKIPKNIEQKPLSKPIGEIFYDDFEWEVILNNKEKNGKISN